MKKPHDSAPQSSRYHEQSSRFAALLAAAVDAIIVIDRNGLIEEFNPAAQRLFGYAPQEVLQQNVKMLMPAPYADEHDRYLERYQHTGEPRIIGIGREVQARCKDGSLFPIELSVGEANENGETCFVGIIRDISERQEARELRQRLTHVSRLSMLGEMASGIAHEINQPLAAITTYAQAARRLHDRGNMAELGEVLDKIVAQADRGASILRKVRSFVRRQEREQESVTAAELVASVIQFLQIDSGRRHIDIEARVDDQLPALLVDVVQIQQVLINLLLNALDATESAGSHAPVSVQARLEDDRLIWFQVADRGCGLGADNEARLFTPFFTTKPSGIGVGLPICRSIIQAHGGELRYRPNPAGGALFEFSLPALADGGRQP